MQKICRFTWNWPVWYCSIFICRISISIQGKCYGVLRISLRPSWALRISAMVRYWREVSRIYPVKLAGQNSRSQCNLIINITSFNFGIDKVLWKEECLNMLIFHSRTFDQLNYPRTIYIYLHETYHCKLLFCNKLCIPWVFLLVHFQRALYLWDGSSKCRQILDSCSS